MSNDLRFDGKVAIVTGAGGGLGRSHALLLAARGAKVVVNDLGGSMHGGGRSSAAADRVVEEIRSAGGEAVANYDSVEDGARIVQAAIDAFGRIDIVINNAGILRDVSFHKMTEEDWELIYRVHVLGAFRVTHAAWPRLRDQGYGRVVMTASAAGIYGNFGQANYSTAKLGLLGFANTLAQEGKKRGIHVNVIAPVAGSRLTETVLPKELTDALRPEYVSPLVAWLCHETCEETGGLFEVGGGFIGKLRWERSVGKTFRLGRTLTPEMMRDHFGAIAAFEKSTHPASVAESMQPIMANVQAGPSKGGNDFIDVDEALGYEFPEMTTAYDERDVSLYALGVGAAHDPLDDKDLQLVYELHGEGQKVLPTFGVVPAIRTMLTLAKEGRKAPGMNYGFERILHGEQYTEILRPLPTRATLKNRMRVKDIWDKGKGAVVVTEVRSFDESGEELIRNEITAFVRGAGGWGGDRGPSAEVNVPPDRAPDAVVEEKIGDNQALLYRLSGDWNPLHADPAFAQAFGFPRPILHGLCTFGYAGRHVIRSFCGGDPRTFKSIKVRFADSVFPGETVVTEMWKESDTRIVLRCRVKEREKVVISNAAVELYREIPQPKAKAAPAPAEAPKAPSEPTSADIFAGIGKYVAKNPDLAGRVGTVFQFRLSAPQSVWTIDLKGGAGSVSAGVSATPDTTLELSDADFLAMCTGKADPQKLYFGGKLKISGNVMASQKLDFLKKVEPALVLEAMRERLGGGGAAAAGPAGGTSAAPAAPAREAMAPAIFAALRERIAESPGLVSEVGACLQFRVTAPEAAWTVDLSRAPGAVAAGEAPGAAATLTLTDEDLTALVRGEATAQALFQRGRLRVDGDVRVAHRLGFLRKLV
jgi:3-hydroxyacyl-CoA dehydrogenase/3a,7a,12a-trihydroxy-5b-cholest-24-enoyl-CoA hydratase